MVDHESLYQPRIRTLLETSMPPIVFHAFRIWERGSDNSCYVSSDTRKYSLASRLTVNDG